VLVGARERRGSLWSRSPRTGCRWGACPPPGGLPPRRRGFSLVWGGAEWGPRHIKACFDLPIGIFGEADRARLGDTFQSRGDIDAVAHQVPVALLDHITEMDANAKLDATLGWNARVALDHAVLHLDSAAHRVDYAAQLY